MVDVDEMNSRTACEKCLCRFDTNAASAARDHDAPAAELAHPFLP
jgi:hypothetical protein